LVLGLRVRGGSGKATAAGVDAAPARPGSAGENVLGMRDELVFEVSVALELDGLLAG
jgi:hypothetical protein